MDTILIPCLKYLIAYQVQNVTTSVTITGTTFPVRSVNSWIIIQSRVDSSYPTGRPWTDYVSGFGNATTSYFWLGLENMYRMTSAANYRLRMEVQAAASAKYAY